MSVLTSKQRTSLPTSAFAIPSSRSYPIHNEDHARAALSMVAQHGSDSEKSLVRAAVRRLYPNIGHGVPMGWSPSSSSGTVSD